MEDGNVTRDSLIAEVLGNVLTYIDRELASNVSYSYTVVAVNRNGPGGRSLPWESYADGTPPIVNILSPSDHNSQNHSIIRLEWEVFEIGSGLSDLWISIDDRESYKMNLSHTNWSTPELEHGQHKITFWAEDIAGNSAYYHLWVTIDLFPPSLEILFPTNGSLHSLGDIIVRYEVSDEIVEDLYGTYILDGEEFPLKDPGSGIIDLNALSDGEHELRISFKDPFWNATVRKVEFMVDTTPPEILGIWPGEGSVINTSKVMVNWSAFDETSGLFGFQLSIAGSTYDIGPELNSMEIDLDDGSYTILLTAADLAGHMAHLTVEVNVDTKPPLVLDHYPKGEMTEKNSKVWVSFAASADIAYFSMDVAGMDGEYVWDEDVLYFIPNGTWDGSREYSATVRAMDMAGNRMEDLTWSFKVSIEYFVNLTVIDQNGDPLKGVRIILEDGQKFVTGINGTFTTELLDGDHTIHLIKDGYRNTEVNVTVRGEDLDLGELKMVPLEDEVEDDPDDEAFPSSVILIVLMVAFVMMALIILIVRAGKGDMYEE
jgi:hypothetical protein